ncbi:hypothetical protein J6S35_02885 [Candidatus Saccharibacteria bacterium]|nr:hypothetical protein [Candidatus Saccharibacteria bacterium]
MHIAKKQLLGLGGLAVVAAMTAFACTLPTGAVPVKGNVEITVEVYDNDSVTRIDRPLDGDVFTGPNITFQETHSHAKIVQYYLAKYNTDGTKEWEKELTEYRVTGDDVSGHTEFILDMDENGGPGKYHFISRLTAPLGPPDEDVVEFVYASISADEHDVSTPAGKVDFRVDYTAGVKSLAYRVYDKDNNPVTDQFIANTDDPENGGYMDLSIDLTDYNLKSGDYTIYIVGYSGLDGTGEVAGTALLTFTYTAPDSPDVPNTGSILSALNISRADFLITGIIGFTAISVVALFVVARTKKCRK